MGKDSKLWWKNGCFVGEIWAMSSDVHFFSVNQYRRAIQCVLKQMIRHQKSQWGHKRRNLAWTCSHYLPSRDFWKPFRPLRHKSADCKVSHPEILSKLQQAETDWWICVWYEGAQSLQYYERCNCGHQVAGRPLFLYMQSKISHISSKQTLTSWWIRTLNIAALNRTSLVYASRTKGLCSGFPDSP